MRCFFNLPCQNFNLDVVLYKLTLAWLLKIYRFANAIPLVRSWIKILRKRHSAHARLFSNEEEVTRLLRDKKEPCALGVPFRPGAIKRLCDKFVRMQNVLNDNPNCTHLELMAEIEPMLAVRYRTVLVKEMTVSYLLFAVQVCCMTCPRDFQIVFMCNVECSRRCADAILSYLCCMVSFFVAWGQVSRG